MTTDMNETIIERAEVSTKVDDTYRLSADAKLYLLGGNERPYFSVTGELRRHGRVEACGCLHDEILAHFPELKPVVDVHLSDDRGIPMHAIANGMYWLGYTKYHDEDLATFASQWRITAAEAQEAADYVRAYADEHADAFDPPTDGMRVLYLAMLDRWQKDADHAVATIRRIGGKS